MPPFRGISGTLFASRNAIEEYLIVHQESKIELLYDLLEHLAGRDLAEDVAHSERELAGNLHRVELQTIPLGEVKLARGMRRERGA